MTCPVWVGRIAGHVAARPTVDAQGDFRWERRTGKKIYVYFRTEDGEVRSARIIIRAR